MSNGTPELSLFVSHTSVDSGLAKALVELFEKALKLPARQIRCTSVDGYRLTVGADTDEQLRREIFIARAFIGLVTPSSLKSAYVLFELGARWGARKHLAPVLGRGADPTIVTGPLSTLNALRLDSRDQVLQLVQDIAEFLEMQMEPMASFQGTVDKVVAEARKIVSGVELRPSVEQPVELDDPQVRLLELLSKTDRLGIDLIARSLNVQEQKALYYVERLEKLGMVGYSFFTNSPTEYYIKQPGREVLVQKGLL